MDKVARGLGAAAERSRRVELLGYPTVEHLLALEALVPAAPVETALTPVAAVAEAVGTAAAVVALTMTTAAQMVAAEEEAPPTPMQTTF